MKRYIRSSIATQSYKGIWFGAKNNPITVRDLLDKVAEREGRGFNIRVNTKYVSDNLLDDATVTEYYLTDEEGRGKFKLNEEARNYLIDSLPEDSWLRSKLI